MQVSFRGYAPADRTISVDESDLALLSDLVRDQFLSYIQYASFSSTYKTNIDEKVLALCAKYDVDGAYPSDRLAFFQALLGVTPND